MNNIPLSTAIFFSVYHQEWIKIDVTSFDKERKNPLSFAVRKGTSVLSKKSGTFCYEPLPSNREDDLFDEFRFDSFESALHCVDKFGLREAERFILGFCKCGKMTYGSLLGGEIGVDEISSMTSIISRGGRVVVERLTVQSEPLTLEACICEG